MIVFKILMATAWTLGVPLSSAGISQAFPESVSIWRSQISPDQPLATASKQNAPRPSLPRIDNRPTRGLSPLVRPVDGLPTAGQIGATSVDTTYTLGAGDLVQVNFFNVPEYSGEQFVLVDGVLNLPMLGRISVAGMTLVEAERAIVEQYRSELRHPQVTLVLLQPRSLQVGIVGEVNQPGLYSLSLQQQDIQFPTVAQIIQVAGGVTQSANLRQIEVRRSRSAGAPQRIHVNLWEFLQNGDLSQNIPLRDGDTIYIPATAEVNLAETSQLAASNLAASSDRILDVALVGEVLRPGAYKLEVQGEVNNRPTLTRAIQLAGGITPSANLRQVEVRRSTRTGAEQRIQINLWDLLQSGDMSQDLVLQQGDTVSIPTATALTSEEVVQLASANLSPDKIQVSVVGQVESPGRIDVAPDTTLNQAVLSAGGFNRRANRSSVQLVRLNPDGTVTERSIAVDFSEGLDPENNPILNNGDVVIVRRAGWASVTDGFEDAGGLLNALFRLISPF